MTPSEEIALGQIVATPAALEVIEASRPDSSHLPPSPCNQDWGDLDDEDKRP